MKFNVLKITALLLVLLTAISCILAACAAPNEGSAETASGKESTVVPSVTTPAVTKDRGKLTLPNLSEDEKAFYQAVWQVHGDWICQTHKELTINDLSVELYMRFDEALVGYYYGEASQFVTAAPAITVETVAGYKFIYGNTLTMSVYTDSKRYSMEQAYDQGLLTKEEIGQIWTKHAENNIYYDLEY